MHFVECEICEFAVSFDHPNETFFFCREHKFGVNVSNADLNRAHICKACGKQMERYNLALEDNVCPICYGMLAMCYNFPKPTEFEIMAQLDKALNYAKKMHAGQLDDSGNDYVKAHCLQVSDILSKVTEDFDLLCAAMLHDTLEDTAATYEDLEAEFGPKIAGLVREVTKIDGKFPNLKTKEGAMLKFADRLSNLSRMDCWDEERQARYLEKSSFWKNWESV